MEIIKDRIELLHLVPKGWVIAELGVFIGEYSQHIIDICQPSKMYLVDIFGNGKAHSSGKQVDDLSQYFHILTGKYTYNPNIHVIKSTTYEFLKDSGDLNMVYIDASHTYEDVKSELEASYKIVNGWISGHDYDKPQVKKAVDEFCVNYLLSIKYLTDKKYGSPSFVIEI